MKKQEMLLHLKNILHTNVDLSASQKGALEEAIQKIKEAKKFNKEIQLEILKILLAILQVAQIFFE